MEDPVQVDYSEANTSVAKIKTVAKAFMEKIL